VVHRLLELDGQRVVITDPNRRLHGDAGPTKVELLTYYMKVAPRMVPFLRGRPVSTVWVPDESTQEFRFAKTAPPRRCGRFPTYCLPSFGESQVDRYLNVSDIRILTALVDCGCLSFHPWSSMAAMALQPNQMVFNLDREAISFREVRNAALLLRDLLTDCGLTAWVKTSGGNGLHLLVPVTGHASFDDVRLVAETIVTRAIRREPTLFSRDLRPARRRGRILIDTSRNDRGATVIAPYAVATSGLVSTLLNWNELQRPIYPEDFGMDSVVAREDFENRAAFFAAVQSLEPLVRCKRARRAAVAIRSHVAQDSEWLLGDTPAAIGDQARWLKKQSRRLQYDAEATRIESAAARQRAKKVVEERQRPSTP
jgi:bifunctional non-homologous end joining protein LigD